MPRILDLFCGAGLVARGLIQAGWEVVGVDREEQPRYPGPFVRHNALTLDRRFIESFDAIWASPECLKDTVLHGSARREQRSHGAAATEHPDLITPTRALLRKSGKPYVIENVMGAALINPVVLCGSMFGLKAVDAGRAFHLERHRKFETNWPLPERTCRHQKPVVGVYGAHARVRSASAGGRGTRDPWERGHQAIMAEAMGIEPGAGLTGNEISQGVPPAFARYVGRNLLIWLAKEGRLGL